MSTLPSFRPRGTPLLLRYRMVAWRNRLTQLLRESPFRALTAVVVICMIWLGLYHLFDGVFSFVRTETFQGIVAIPLILDIFFVALMVMLVFSNGIIAYGSLFSRDESEFLLSQPLHASTVTMVKLLESLLLSSWSLVLVGLPLLAALAGPDAYLPEYYYAFFIVFFVAFIPIPGAVGVVLAWAVGYYLSRVTRRLLWVFGAVTLIIGLVWVSRSWGGEQLDSGRWLAAFFDRASLMQGAFWPSSWVSKGLSAARNAELNQAFFYLFVTASTAMFSCWLAVRIVGQRLLQAYDRVRAFSSGGVYSGHATRRLAGILFFYMPDDLREIALKDLRSFLRDPVQWSQQLILMGLLAIYAVNIRDVPMRINAFNLQLLISFLNLAAISLLLATFTSRFVFPLITLETQQLWLVGLLPMPRGRILIPKFAFALTVTFVAGGAVTLLASQVGRASVELAIINLLAVGGVCVALCGLAVGLGGRFPMIGERNPARIASGLGGTINLAVSLSVVGCLLGVCFIMGIRFYRMGMILADSTTILCITVLLGGAIGVAWMALRWGERHFARIEC